MQGVICSPVVPVISTSYLMKKIKQTSQSSLEDEDSNDSSESYSLISTQPQIVKKVKKPEIKNVCSISPKLADLNNLVENKVYIREESQDQTTKRARLPREKMEQKKVKCMVNSDSDKDLVTLNSIENDSKIYNSREVIHEGKLPKEKEMLSQIMEHAFNGCDDCYNMGENVLALVTELQETFMPEIEHQKNSEVKNLKNGSPVHRTEIINDANRGSTMINLESLVTFKEKGVNTVVSSYEMKALANALENQEKLQLFHAENKSLGASISCIPQYESCKHNNRQLGPSKHIDLSHLTDNDCDCLEVNKFKSVDRKTKYQDENQETITVSTQVLHDEGMMKLSQKTLYDTDKCLTTTLPSLENCLDDCYMDSKEVGETFDGSQNLFTDTQSTISSLSKSSYFPFTEKEKMHKKPDIPADNFSTSGKFIEADKICNNDDNIEYSSDGKCVSETLDLWRKDINKSSPFNNQDMRRDKGSDYVRSSSKKTSDLNPVIESTANLKSNTAFQSYLQTGDDSRDKTSVTLLESQDRLHDHSKCNSKSSLAQNNSSTLRNESRDIKEMEINCISETSSACELNNDLDFSSDVEPSQMILMSTWQDTHSDNRLLEVDHIMSSQSSSSLSSLGDISESHSNYKKKEHDILSKVERLQYKIEKKLNSVSRRNSAIDIEVTKQQIQGIKGILIKIAERHKVERNKYSVEIKKCIKSKTEKNIIRENLIELGERQKSLYKLFQKHKEISNKIRNDVKLNETLASSLTNTGEKSNKSEAMKTMKGKTRKSKKGKMKENSENEKGLTNTVSYDTIKSPKMFKKLFSKCQTASESSADMKKSVRSKRDIVKHANELMSKNMKDTDYSSFKNDWTRENSLTKNSKYSSCGKNFDSLKNSDSKGKRSENINYSVSLNGTQEIYCDAESDVSAQNRLKNDAVDISGEITQTIKKNVHSSTKNNFLNSTSSENDNNDEMFRKIGIYTSKISSVVTSTSAILPQDHLHVDSVGQCCFAIDDMKCGKRNPVFVDFQNEKDYQKKSRNVEKPAKKNIEIDSDVVQTCKFVHQINTERPNLAPLSQQEQKTMNSVDGNQAIKITGNQSSSEISGVPSTASIILSQLSKSVNASTSNSDVIISMQKNNSALQTFPAEQIFNTNKRFKSTSQISSEDNNTLFVYKLKEFKSAKGKTTDLSENFNNARSAETHAKSKSFDPYASSLKVAKSNALKTKKTGKSEIYSQNDSMKKVIEDAMRIINYRSETSSMKHSVTGTANNKRKRPIIGTEDDWQPKQAKLHTAESLQQISEDLDPSPCGLYNGLKYPPLDLLIEKGMLKPGRKVLSVYARNKEFRASLTADGYIESLGGELFHTPVKWLAAVLGKPLSDVKKNKGYKEVRYHGRSLMACAENPTLVPENEHSSPNLTQEQVERHPSSPDSQSSQDSMKKLKNLLNSCTIRLLNEEDLVGDEDLPENFWTEDFSKVKLSQDMWNVVDKWD